jgi:hypothetical protein
MTKLLEVITLSFPLIADSFSEQFLTLLSPQGRRDADQLEISCSGVKFLPRIKLSFSGEGDDVQAHFFLAHEKMLCLSITNTTGIYKLHPKPYQHLKLETINHRLVTAGIRLTEIDHVGANLPWFGKRIHPQISNLRERLSSSCLYHHYPSGELWDFILPGDAAEISRQNAIDYNMVRRPKFELVSFELASTPLVQIDILSTGNFKSLSALFPEALADPEFKTIWLYTQNPYGIDICLVLNEPSRQDWSKFFSGCRL